jgi:hypothetical protein
VVGGAVFHADSRIDSARLIAPEPTFFEALMSFERCDDEAS